MAMDQLRPNSRPSQKVLLIDMQMIMSIQHEEKQASMETCNYALGDSEIDYSDWVI